MEIEGHTVLKNLLPQPKIRSGNSTCDYYKLLPFAVPAKKAKLQQETVEVNDHGSVGHNLFSDKDKAGNQKTQCEVKDVVPKPNTLRFGNHKPRKELSTTFIKSLNKTLKEFNTFKTDTSSSFTDAKPLDTLPKEAINEIKVDQLCSPLEASQKLIDLQLESAPSDIPKKLPEEVSITVHSHVEPVEQSQNTESEKLPGASTIDIQSIIKLLDSTQHTKLTKISIALQGIRLPVKPVEQTQCTKYENQSYIVTVKRLCSKRTETYVNFLKPKPPKRSTITKNIKNDNIFIECAYLVAKARCGRNATTNAIIFAMNNIVKEMQDEERILAETNFKPDVDTSKPLPIGIEEDKDPNFTVKTLRAVPIPMVNSPTKKCESWDRFESEKIAVEKALKMPELPLSKALAMKKTVQPKCHTKCGTKKDNNNTKVDCPTNSNLNKLETIIDDYSCGCSSRMMLELDC